MLETEATLEIKELIAEFRPGEGDLLATLHKVQHRYGYIPPPAIPVVARHLRLGEARVYGAITFYSEFRLTPPAETTISWCSGPACRVRGGDRIRAVLEAVLGIGMGENTPDGRLGLHLAQCNGTCDHAPQVWVNGRVVGPLTVSDAIRLARKLKANGRARGRRGKAK
jgi:NADH:ubiquinone oxidoreductase subunit E